MTIDEAITELTSQLIMQNILGGTYHADALKLGIEALKFIQDGRRDFTAVIWRLLPGETT